MKKKTSDFSLKSRGARYQLRIMVALIVVLPFLAFLFLVLTARQDVEVYSEASRFFIAMLAVAVGLIGYFMLRQRVENVVRLRNYLQHIAAGEFPESVDLFKSETDMAAIETSLNIIIGQMRRKVAMLEEQLAVSRRMQETIRKQDREILAAEQQRVMIQSLGTACHHIGQPATVLRACLEMLARELPASAAREKLNDCITAIESIAEILDKLRKVGEYRPVPFKSSHNALEEDRSGDIIDIGE